MWTVVHIALDMPGAELARSVLSRRDLGQLRPVGVPYVGDSGSVEYSSPNPKQRKHSKCWPRRSNSA